MTNTTNDGKPYLSMLETRLGEGGRETIYPCIQDLVEHGLVLTRFSGGKSPPLRQDITQYLASWSKHAGLSEDEARGWLVEYCANLLKPISKRTPAAIRHSTKSNLKYIYNSELDFLCQRETNAFHAHCNTGCPVYGDMQAKAQTRAEEALKPKVYVPAQTPEIKSEPRVKKVKVVVPNVKKLYAEQFQNAMKLAQEEVRKGESLKRVAELLNERGFKTRMGRSWYYAILRTEIMGIQKSQNGL
jgi:hypothetical protein